MRSGIVIAGGGTAGHIMPGIAVAGKLKQEVPDARILFVNDGGGRELLADSGFSVKTVKCSPVAGKSVFRLPAALINVVYGIFQSLKILREFNPRVVIGTGGYAGAPMIAAGILSGKRIILLEQNYAPGLATRIFSIFAREVELSFKGSEKYLFRKGNCRVTGNPVRDEILSVSREESLNGLGLPPGKHVLAVFGGSIGAHRINLALELFSDRYGRGGAGGLADCWKIVHITGKNDYNYMKGVYLRSDFSAVTAPFINRMEYVYGCADVIVARAGGNTVAETAARGIPAIFVPYPYAAGGHQALNAAQAEKNGGCFVVDDKKICTGVFFEKLLLLMRNAELRMNMAEAAGKSGMPLASEVVTERIKNCLKT